MPGWPMAGELPGSSESLQDTTLLRRALGRFATGVTIVTCRAADGHRVGLTANSFNSLSLSPPLVLWSLRQNSPSLDAFVHAPAFAINVLTAEQIELSRRFASKVDDRFALGDWREGLHGLPVLEGAAAVFECALHGYHLAGDHTLFIGRVLAAREQEAAPLLYQGSHYHGLGPVL